MPFESLVATAAVVGLDPTATGPLTEITKPTTIVYVGENTKGKGSGGTAKNKTRCAAAAAAAACRRRCRRCCRRCRRCCRCSCHSGITRAQKNVGVFHVCDCSCCENDSVHVPIVARYEALFCFDPTQNQIRGPISQYKGNQLQVEHSLPLPTAID